MKGLEERAMEGEGPSRPCGEEIQDGRKLLVILGAVAQLQLPPPGAAPSRACIDGNLRGLVGRAMKD